MQAPIANLGPLTFVYVREDEGEGITAHCLELDLAGQGGNLDEAREDVQRAVETYILYHLDTARELRARPAPEDLLESGATRETFHLLVLERTRSKKKPKREVVFVPPPPPTFSPAALASA